MTNETDSALPVPWHDAHWARISRQLAGGELPHALLLAGPAGLGKRHFARRLAQAYLCGTRSADATACGLCRDCALVEAGSHPDWVRLTPEAGKTEIGIGAIRDVITRLMLTGGSGRRVAIIDPAHAMNRNSANAFLKTLEEPPGGVLLLLVTELPHRLPPTIRSRCQDVTFRAPGREAALDWLRGQQGAGNAEWDETLKLAGGAPLRAVQLAAPEAQGRRTRLLDDLVALGRGNSSPELVSAAWCKEPQVLPELLDTFSRWLARYLKDGGGGPPLQALLSGVNSSAVFALYDEVNRVRATLDTQLRSDLMIEALLIQWLQLTSEQDTAIP